MNGPFYYRHQDQEVGPLTPHELKEHAANGKLSPQDHVWTHDVPQGFLAHKIKGLFPAAHHSALAGSEIAGSEIAGSANAGSAGNTKTSLKSDETNQAHASTSSPLDVVRRFLFAAAGEVVKTAKACRGQVMLIVEYVRKAFAARIAERDAARARLAVGEKLYAEKLGDPSLHAQIDQLDERTKSLRAANASIKSVHLERQGLYLRLAEPFLESAKGPEKIAGELGIARERLAHRDAAQSQFKEQRLLPADGANRMRVLAGSLSIVLLVWLGVHLTKQSNPYADLPGAEAKEMWFDANDNFPRRLAVGTFVNNKAFGEIKFYDDQRRLIGVQSFKDDNPHGPFTFYYPSGKKLASGEYVDGQREGMQTAWFENGEVAETLECSKGNPHGKHVLYYETGGKFVEREWRDGKMTGKLNGYTPDGRLCSIITYEDGKVAKEEDVIQATAEEQSAITQRSQLQFGLNRFWGDSGSGSGSARPIAGNDNLGGGSSNYDSGSQTSLCNNCFGTGQSDCQACFGRGTHSCYGCNGSGRTPNNLQCITCNGTGQQDCTFCNYGKVQCPQCFGSGRK